MTNKTGPTKQSRAAVESTAFLLVIVGVAVAVNALTVFINPRLDLTHANLFSLSNGSKRLAAGLDDQMEVRAYFSADLPPPHNATERYVRDLLAEYETASKGKLRVRYIHPETDEQKQDAERDGVVRVQDPSIEDDSFTVKEGFRGLSFHYLGETKAIDKVDGTAGLEYAITQTIKQLVGEKTKIGLLGEHGGPTLTEGLSSLKQHLPTYDMVDVNANSEIPQDLRALLIVSPTTPLSDTELRHIDQFVMRGGSVGFLGGAHNVTIEQQKPPVAAPVDSGINKLLEKWGVRMESAIVADEQCGRAEMPTRFGFRLPVPYPPAPTVSFTEEQRTHHVLFNLNQVGLPYPANLTLSSPLDAQIKRTVIAQSTPRAWLMTGDTVDLNPRESWETGPRAVRNLAIALEGKLPSAFANAASSADAPAAPSTITAPERAEKNVHVLVLGTSYFIHDRFLPPPQQMQGMNASVALALNAIDWLAQDGDLIAIRAKTVEDPTLEIPANVKEAEATVREAAEEGDQAKAEAAIEEGRAAIEQWKARKNTYQWANMLGIPLAFALLGVARWRFRRAQKATVQL